VEWNRCKSDNLTADTGIPQVKVGASASQEFQGVRCSFNYYNVGLLLSHIQISLRLIRCEQNAVFKFNMHTTIGRSGNCAL
jgi:hypothetical protein